MVMNEWDKLRHFVLITARGYIPSTLIVSEGGLGKSYNVQKILHEEGVEHTYINTFTTPLALYKLLYLNRDKLIVLDDVNALFNNMKTVAMLKGALWPSGADNKRVVSYHTTTKLSETDDIPAQFEFTGKIIILSNDAGGNNPHMRALVSRMNMLKMEFTYAEKLDIIKEVAEKIGVESEIVDFIIQHSSEACNMNIRTLIKIKSYFDYSQDDWQDLALIELAEDPKLSDIMTDMTMIQWCQKYGLTKRTYFRYKRKVK